MNLRLLAFALLMAAVAACSDDDKPPAWQDGPPSTDGGDGGDLPRFDQGVDLDPKCPMPGPCILTKLGEGKHSYLVIGELLTFTGKELESVTTVYIGASEAPILSVSAAKIVCRIGRRTPPGQHTVEIKAADKRRMAGVVDVRRLVVTAAEDDTNLTTFEAATHSAGPVLDLGFSPVGRPTVSHTGRYVVAAGAGKLALADLALEQVASVSGLTEDAASWAVDHDDRTLAVATKSGKLLSVDLSTFPTLAAKSVSAAPGTAVVTLAAPDLFVGLNPDAASGQGSLWYAKTDLKTVTWVQASGQPFLVGAGKGLKGQDVDGRDGWVGMLALEGSNMRLALAKVDSGTLKDPTAPAVAGGLGLALTAGGKYVALSTDDTKPALPYFETAVPTAAKSVDLGQGGASRLLARQMPTFDHLVLALVGPLPGAAQFKAPALELVDLASAKRLTLAGSKPALELADMLDAAADPAADAVHLITPTHYHSFMISISGTTLTVTEKHPNQQLPAGKKNSWIGIQP